MMIFLRLKQIDVGLIPAVHKFICTVSCLLGMYTSGQHAKDSVNYSTTVEKEHLEKAIVFVSTGTTIVNLSPSDDYIVIHQHKDTKSETAQLNKHSAKKIKQRIFTAVKKKLILKEHSPIIWVFKELPAQNTYEKYQNSSVSFVIPNYHQLDKKFKNCLLNSVSLFSTCLYADSIQVKNTLIQLEFHNFSSFFARPPPM